VCLLDDGRARLWDGTTKMAGLLTATRAAASSGFPAPVAALALMRRALATAPGTDGAGATPPKSIEKLKARLADGPSFQDFVAGGKSGAVVDDGTDDGADDATPVAPPGRPAKTQYKSVQTALSVWAAWLSNFLCGT